MDSRFTTKYFCFCGRSAEMHHVVTYDLEDSTKITSETTLTFQHPEPVTTACLELRALLIEEEKAALKRVMKHSMQTMYDALSQKLQSL